MFKSLRKSQVFQAQQAMRRRLQFGIAALVLMCGAFVQATLLPAAEAQPNGGERKTVAADWRDASGETFAPFKMPNGNSSGVFRNRLAEPMEQPNELKLRAESFDKLIEQAGKSGSVRVIVGLQVDFKPEGQMRAAEAEAQREAIQAAQDSLLGKLGQFAERNVKRFEYIPYLALEVDAVALEFMKNDPAVISIKEDEVREPTLLESTRVVGANASWLAGLTGSGWTVAILDTGVDKTHPFLSGKVVSEACYSYTGNDSSGNSYTSTCPGGVASSTASGSGVNCATSITGCDHGTHVAGIAAGNNVSSEADGVARASNIISIQVFSRRTNDNKALTFDSEYIKGLERVYALRGTYNIAAANMSLGGGGTTSNCDASEAAIKAAIDNLRSANIATVISSGNDGYTNGLSSPACISTAISVGSTRDGGSDVTTGAVDTVSTTFSNSASFLSILAPGEAIISSVPGTGYSSKNGTSMAAPHVAGAWAILKERMGSGATVQQVLDRLNSTGVSVTDSRNNITKKRIKIDAAVYVGCNPSISPGSASVSGLGASGSFGVTISSCGWNAISNASWITTSGSGNSNGTVSYTAAANDTGSSRTGTISVAGQTFTITQAINCTPILTSYSASFGGGGGTGSFSVSYPTACGNANSTNNNNTWLSGSISGNTINYTVLTNTTGATRTGSFTVIGSNGSATHTITQTACASSVSSPSNNPNDLGGTGGFNVAISTGCSYTATSNQSWATITSGASGTTSGTVVYSVAANTGASSRTATISVTGGATHTITQSGAPACTYSLSSTSRTVDADADNFSFSVQPNRPYCSWTASVTSGSSWLSINSGASGTGTASVGYTVTTNNSTSTRTGTIVAGGQTFTVTQTGVCTFAPSNQIAWYRGENNASDSAGSNNGTGSGATYQAAKVGQGIKFDGVDDRVEIPAAAALKPANLAVEAWIKFDSLTSTVTGGAPGGTQFLVFKKNTRAAQFEGYSLVKESNNRLSFAVSSAAGVSRVALGTTVVTTGVYYHVVGTYDGTASRIYVNGQLEATTSGAIALDYDTRPVFLGTSGETYDGKFNGVLDETTIYSRAISLAEIQEIYNAGAAGKCFQCSYSLNPVSANIAAAGASNQTIVITATTGCIWSAVSNSSWLTTTSSGTGSGTITFSVAANTSTSSRTGTISVGGQTFTVTQAAGQPSCTYTHSPTSLGAPGAGGSGYSFAVNTQTGCAWTATSSTSWATITGGSSGTGNGTVFFNVAANPGTTRFALISAGGADFDIIQSADCSSIISPTSKSVAAASSTGITSVTVNAVCSWTAVANASWLTVTGGASSSGNGAVAYAVAANPGASARTGTITIAGRTFTVTQAAPIYESDVAARPNGNGNLQANDVIQMLRFLNELDAPATSPNEFQRADSAPRTNSGNGVIDAADIVQTIRYLNEVDALQFVGGALAPNNPLAPPNEDDSGSSNSGNDARAPSAPHAAPELRVESATGVAGNQVTVPIRADAVGNEAQYGFAVLFNPNLLAYSSFSAGSTGSGTFSCNATATPGRVRCAVGNFPGNLAGTDPVIGEIAAGNNQLLIRVNFTLAAGTANNTATPVTLGSASASDEAANSITPATTSGAVTINSPTAAAAQLTGRVTSVAGRGISGATVKMTDEAGSARTARTNSFGYYRFDEVSAGQTVVIAVSSKRFVFAVPLRVVTVTEDLTEVNFTAF